MAAKTLSTSTLSLKFMQKRSAAPVALAQADVRDDVDGAWALPGADAWGPAPGSSQAVSYEASYIPFLFAGADADAEQGAGQAKGRRAFKRGREVADADGSEPAPAPASTRTPPPTSAKSKPRPSGGISGGGATPRKSRDNSTKNLPKAAGKGKTAREAIYDSSGVGADLRGPKPGGAAAPSTPTPVPAPAPAAFIKPNVDDAPHDTPVAAGKRARDETPGEKKPKKKKRAKAEAGEGEGE
ncbi:hypothetical protein B0H10DRAFT_1999913 [Mycena sp. CBHHK59/15]|nr:hypothetical protein B0H10DRAFT_1999913 [Mycena sp. CBHHK59/15]